MWAKLVKGNKFILILLVSLILIGIIILTNYFSFSNIKDLIESQMKENQMTNTKHVASQIESHILQVKDELVTLSKFPIIDKIGANKCSNDIHEEIQVVHEKIAGKVSSLLKVDKEGNIIECSSPAYSSYLGLNIRNKDYFIKPRETHEPFVEGVTRQGANMQIIVSAPLFETTKYTPYPNFIGEFKGILLSFVDLNDFYNLYIHQIIQTDKNFFLLINLNTGETLIKSNNIKDYNEIKDSLPEAKKGLNGIYNMGNWGQTITTSSDLILGSETWRLIIFTPLKGVEEEMSSVQNRNLLSLGSVLIVIISMVYLLISLYKSKEEVQLKLKKANVTLEKLGINIEVEKEKFNQAEIDLESKKTYLIKEDDENNAHELFIGTLNQGFAGLGIVREDPREIKKRYNLQKTSFIWLTNHKLSGVPSETKIANLFGLISEFVSKSKKSVIMIDRLDYILSENNFEDVIKTIHALKDLAHNNECIIIISANPELIEHAKMKAIEAETIDLYGRHLRRNVELSEQEIGILKLINDKNVVNKLVSYKDITDTFKITKPTTRVKLSKLQGLSLLHVEQKGRFKSLKITSAGRRIIGE